MASPRVPGGPSRQIPTHPPYSLMIDTALRSLANEGGSSQEAISAYIVANFDGLPWGHDRLLPYYLQKLTDQGEFVVVAPGRYSIAGENNEPVSGFVSTEGNGGVLPKPQSERNHVDVATTQQKDETRTPSSPKRRGRRSKRNKLRARRGIDGEGGRGGTEPTPQPEPERDHADVRVPEVTTQQNADVGAHSASKRRGLPPKTNKLTPRMGTDGEGDRDGTESTPSPEPKRDHADLRVAEATAQQNAEAGSSWASRRRRTRPKMNKLSARRGTDGGGGQSGTGSTPPPEPERDHSDV